MTNVTCHSNKYQDADLVVTMTLLTLATPALSQEPTKLVLRSPDSSLFASCCLLAIAEEINIWRCFVVYCLLKSAQISPVCLLLPVACSPVSMSVYTQLCGSPGILMTPGYSVTLQYLSPRFNLLGIRYYRYHAYNTDN